MKDINFIVRRFYGSTRKNIWIWLDTLHCIHHIIKGHRDFIICDIYADKGFEEKKEKYGDVLHFVSELHVLVRRRGITHN